jgi:ATP-GRASP peptide maturase of grasp-with-spasm system
MVLVFTDDTTDKSAYDVCDWLKYLNHEFVVIDDKRPKIEFVDYKLSNTEEEISFNYLKKKINLTDFYTYYWRRGYLRFINSYPKLRSSDTLNYDIGYHLYKEDKILVEDILKILESKRGIGSFFSNQSENKLTSLRNAKKVGLSIPNTIITSTSEEIKSFVKPKLGGITKAISDGISIEIDGKYYYQYTEEFTINNLGKKTNKFFPTLFQEKLDKEFELRIFYLHKKCYAMAVFSQNDMQTSIDFRKYNWLKPNRTVPYDLPIDVENKLVTFMQKLNLDTGSIDMVYTKDEDYVFLEVNPVGQFAMVSEPCNYSIEKEIAKFLISENKYNEKEKLFN